LTASFTVFGAAGYIGRHLVAALTQAGHTVRQVVRDDWPRPGEHLGHGLFTIGITAGFRGQPLETLDTHVVSLHAALKRFTFDSFLYVSSTRLYQGAESTAEPARLSVSPADPEDSYNSSKLAGESTVLSLGRETNRVARLSNVFGGSVRVVPAIGTTRCWAPSLSYVPHFRGEL
jgi:nucleoside-diphosphate-sugar epimerase